jgi:hypothetical protein
VKAQAPSAATAFGAPGTVRPTDAAHKSAEADYPERALPAAERRRAALLGTLIAVVGIAAAALVAVLFVAAVFENGVS